MQCNSTGIVEKLSLVKLNTILMLNKLKDKIKSVIILGLIFSMPTLKAQSVDSDGDGVSDALDLCPATTAGTQVNLHGCPINLTNCDYNTSSFTVVSAPAPSGVQTKYVLADALDGKIVQIANTPTFSNLVGSKTYMVLAYSYEDNNTVVNLNTGNFLNQVNSSCGDWSRALPVKVCAPFIDNNTCDFTTSSFTLKATLAPSGATTKYLLVNQSGIIIKLSDTPTFTGLSGSNTYNAYSISYTGSVNNLSLGSNISGVTGTCLDWSLPFSVKVCVCSTDCIPVSITRIK
jgi:hypothetical protein